VSIILGLESKLLTSHSPWGINDPTEGQRQIIANPFDAQASEFGWHSDGTDWFKTTRGNNGVAQTNWDNKQDDLLSQPRPTARDLKFHYPYSLNETDYKKYANASVTQLFYTSNKYHDLLHTLGFNERAGNFEANNNGAGGLGADFAYLNAQDGSGTNNANFATPPDVWPPFPIPMHRVLVFATLYPCFCGVGTLIEVLGPKPAHAHVHLDQHQPRPRLFFRSRRCNS
jgi:hypothetical protein